MAGLTDATGDLANLNDTAHEILARLVFDGNGGCEVWLAMYLEGENDFNFIDTRAYVVPDDDTGLELRGEFMGGEMQEGILSVDATGALYVSCEVDSDLVDGSTACWRTCGIWMTRAGRMTILSPCRKTRWHIIAACPSWTSPAPT